MTKSMFWADQIAREVIEKVEHNEELKKRVNKHGFVILDEKTPSGKIHIGAGRGWIIHDAVAKALRDEGVKATFTLSADDIDPFDKMNSDLPKSYEQYLGMPFRDMPSPVEGYKSFADYYFMQCVEKFEDFGISAEIDSTGSWYDKGLFNDTIKTALNNIPTIAKIYEETSGKEYNKFPFNPICEKCGKVGTTRGYEWDAEKEVVKYKCEEDYVKWARGCGYEGEISPYNGNGKFPWKVEWAAKWPVKSVIYEVAGKDHFTKGGSRDVSIRIADQVFNYSPPLPSKVHGSGENKGYVPGKAYEFFNIGGKKMSTSKGQGIGFGEATTILPPHIIRFLLIGSRPGTVIDFDPYNKNDLVLLFDRYDKTERIYFGKEEVEEKEKMQNKRIYELSHVGEMPTKMPIQIALTYAATVIQVGQDVDGAIELLKKSGHLPEKISDYDKKHLDMRFQDAQQWIEKFAPEENKFVIAEKVNDDIKKQLDDKQKEVLHLLAQDLKKKEWTEEELHNHFWQICQDNDIKVKHFFEAAYSAIINRARGPKLANFVLTIGKDKVAELFEQV
jgi:lysyl-tRNA synthetase, class I